MNFIKATAWTLALIAFFVLAWQWSAYRDRVLAASEAKYEACVMAQFHTTPWAYYAEHGETAVCN